MKRTKPAAALVVAAAMAVSGFGLPGLNSAARADENTKVSRDESDPGRHKDPGEGKVTGTAADVKGTSNRIGGRDLPPSAKERDKNQDKDRAETAAESSRTERIRTEGTRSDNSGADSATNARQPVGTPRLPPAEPPPPGEAEGRVTVRTEERTGQRGEDRTQGANLKPVFHVLAEATETSVTRGSLDRLVSYFHREDRDRMNAAELTKVDSADLDAEIARFRQNWKEKYGWEFDIKAKDESVVFADVTTHAVGNEARTAGAVIGTSGSDRGDAKTGGGAGASERADVKGDAKSGGTEGRTNRGDVSTDDATPGRHKEPGEGKVTGTAADVKGTSDRIGGRDLPPSAGDAAERARNEAEQTNDRTVESAESAESTVRTSQNAATAAAAGASAKATPDQITVRFPQSHGLKVANIELVREGGDWKIDVADRLSKGELRNNLIQHLTQLNGDVSKWPAEANEAYGLVAHHMLLAMEDTGVGARPTNAVIEGGKTREGEGPGR